jgi:hypothetical protein
MGEKLGVVLNCEFKFNPEPDREAAIAAAMIPESPAVAEAKSSFPSVILKGVVDILSTRVMV